MDWRRDSQIIVVRRKYKGKTSSSRNGWMVEKLSQPITVTAAATGFSR
jgi:hypothetical protein